MCVCERESSSVCVCVCERERAPVCVCVCVLSVCLLNHRELIICEWPNTVNTRQHTLTPKYCILYLVLLLLIEG